MSKFYKENSVSNQFIKKALLGAAIVLNLSACGDESVVDNDGLSVLEELDEDVRTRMTGLWLL